MPTLHPRLNVVLEKPILDTLTKAAKRAGQSLSHKARDLLRDALEMEEDASWVRKARERSKTFDPRKALSHDEVWKKST